MRILFFAFLFLLAGESAALARDRIHCGAFVFNNLYEPAEDGEGEPAGFFADVMREAAARLGLQVSFAEVGSFATAYDELKNKRYDMLCASIGTHAANYGKMLFSDVLFYDPLYPFGDAGRDYGAIRQAQDINHPRWRIAGMEGELSAYYAPILFPQAQRHLASQFSPVGLIMADMFAGKADMVLLTQAAADAYQQDNPGTLKKILEEPVALYPVRFVFRPGDMRRKLMFDAVFQDMKAEGIVGRLLKANGISVPPGK